MIIPGQPEAVPCFLCGVRPDVTCRHRPGVARPANPTLVEDETIDRRKFNNRWSRPACQGTSQTEIVRRLKKIIAGE